MSFFKSDVAVKHAQSFVTSQNSNQFAPSMSSFKRQAAQLDGGRIYLFIV